MKATRIASFAILISGVANMEQQSKGAAWCMAGEAKVNYRGTHGSW